GFAPYQNILNIGSDFLFFWIKDVVPESARHIDASRILSGTPLGGPNALIPQAREWIFDRLGIRGFAADVIRNPLQISPGGPVRFQWTPYFPAGPLPFPLPNQFPA